jgi:hypothetical protein
VVDELVVGDGADVEVVLEVLVVWEGADVEVVLEVLVVLVPSLPHLATRKFLVFFWSVAESVTE